MIVFLKIYKILLMCFTFFFFLGSQYFNHLISHTRDDLLLLDGLLLPNFYCGHEVYKASQLLEHWRVRLGKEVPELNAVRLHRYPAGLQDEKPMNGHIFFFR